MFNRTRPPEGPDGSDPARHRGRSRARRSRLGLLVRYVLIPVVAMVLVAAAGAWWLQRDLGGKIDHLSGALPSASTRPAKDPEAGDTLNILVLGSDSRTGVAGSRSDATMIVQVSADRKNVSVISIPRDVWVDVPGHGKAKINAALSWGGTALSVQTVEQLTGLRIDHVALVHWSGFKNITNALGGVTVTVPRTVYDSARKITWTAGKHHLNGQQALDYVGQRHGLPGGDFDRVKRQQNFMRALMSQLMDKGLLSSPVKLYKVLSAVTSNLAVDAGWSTSDLRGLAWSLHDINRAHVRFATVPISGTGTEGGQDVDFLDTAKADVLWRDLRTGQAAQWIQQTGANLSRTVN